MTKIDFVNGQEPALSAENLNQMQSNIETSINEVATDVGNAQTDITTLQGITKSVDANGWTKLVYGNGMIEYIKAVTINVSLNGSSWGRYDITDMPVGYTSSTSNIIVTSSVFSYDSALAPCVGVYTHSGTKLVRATVQNAYNGSVTSSIDINLRALVIPS